ncbi:MAG: amino acid adenylation domain-containing protein [Flavobacteriaceae bacterium]|nr:MAG: amino acid adenylation domain-containing protein [Flavobacteriaceae bacterium]
MNINLDTLNKKSNLSDNQLLIWITQQSHPCIPLYNSPFLFTFKTKINVNYFKKSFQELLNQHDALRTRIINKDDTPFQEIADKFDHDLEFIDWEHDIEKDTNINSYLQQRAEKVIDIRKSCFDSSLIKIHSDKYIWFFNQHHITTDMWSFSILFKKIMAYYQAFLTGKPESNILTPQYKEYLKYQGKLVSTPRWKQAQKYWLEKEKELKKSHGLHQLRNNETPTSSVRITNSLGEDRSKRLLEISALNEFRSFTKNLTDLSILATIVISYIHRTTDEEKITIALPIHNRISKEQKNTLGLFMDLLPLSLTVDKEDSFLQLFEKVKIEINSFMLNAQACMATPKMHRNYEYILSYNNVTFPDLEDIPYTVKWIHPNAIDSHHVFRIEIHDFFDTGHYLFEFDFNSSLIDKTRQQSAVDQIFRLFDAFLEDYNQPINSVKIISEEEERKLMVFGNAVTTLIPIEDSIIDRFRDMANTYPNRTAVSTEEEKVTYSELNKKSNQIAHYLINTGIKSETVVAVHLARNVNLIASILGILKAGAAYLPLSKIYPKERIKFMIEDVKADYLITSKELENDVDFFSGDKIIIDTLDTTEQTNSLQKILPSQLAFIIYTSGSTGRPKGAMNEHKAVVRLAQVMHDEICEDYKSHLNIAMVAPIVFDISVMQIFTSLLYGHSLFLVPENMRFSGAQLHKFFIDNNIHFSDGTPAHLSLLLDSPKNGSLPTHLNIAGEKLTHNAIENLQNHFNICKTKISNGYGVAECGVISTMFTFPLSRKFKNISSIPIGRPHSKDRIFILSEHNQLQPIGISGELCIGGLGVGRGYVNNINLTKEKFITNPFNKNEKLYKTGDYAKWLEDGTIEYINRKDNQVQIRGYRVELGEIQNQLLKFIKNHHSNTINIGINSAEITVIEDKNNEKYICAYFMSDHLLKTAEIRSFMAKQLPHYMVPTYFIQIEKMPLNFNGKIDYDALPRPDFKKLKRENDYVAPNNEIERLIAEIWQEVFDIKKIGIYDNFFVLGGHSLMAIKIVSRIKEVLDLTVPLLEVFNKPTISDLAILVEKIIKQSLVNEGSV